MVDVITFLIAGAVVLGGGIGVIVLANPVRAALSLVASFFGVAVLFVMQQAHFLAFVQVVVYAGAIVVLFLFVIMLLGVDRQDDIRAEPLAGQRPAAALLGLMVLGLILGGLFLSGPGGDDGAVALTGTKSRTAPISQLTESESDVTVLAEDLFTRNIVAVQATALLLTIATVGAVVFVRNKGGEEMVVDDPGTARR